MINFSTNSCLNSTVTPQQLVTETFRGSDTKITDTLAEFNLPISVRGRTFLTFLGHETYIINLLKLNTSQKK